MAVNGLVLLTIVGMAAATYATRAGGLWLLSRLELGPRAETWLKQVPGAIIVAVVAPGVLNQGSAEAVAGVLTLVVAARTRSLPLAMVCGVIAVVALRRWWG
jgi:uncharacterized membrane protein